MPRGIYPRNSSKEVKAEQSPLGKTPEDRALVVLQKVYSTNTIGAYVALAEIFPDKWKDTVRKHNALIAEAMITEAARILNDELHQDLMKELANENCNRSINRN